MGRMVEVLVRGVLGGAGKHVLGGIGGGGTCMRRYSGIGLLGVRWGRRLRKIVL